MRKESEIIRQYEGTSFFERMHLFLQFPDLREIFQEIECYESEAQRLTAVKAEQQIKGTGRSIFGVPVRC
jgi:hypothetical protein